MNAIENTLVKILSFIKEYKYCPAKVGTLDYTVDFCKGSPGLIPMFILAVEVFPKIADYCLLAAEEAGKLTWKEGLLL